MPTAFTLIRGESRRFFRFAAPDGRVMWFGEPAPYILDAGGEELKHAVSHGPDLVVAETSPAEARPGDLAAALVRLGAGAAAVAAGGLVRVVTDAGDWTARMEAPDPRQSPPPPRGPRPPRCRRAS